MTKQDAHNAAKASGAFAVEIAGEGSGIIGAVACAGLRLSGEDGSSGKLSRFRLGERYTVAELLEAPYVQAVELVDGSVPAADEAVLVTNYVKPAMVHGRLVIVVENSQRGLCALDFDSLKHLGTCAINNTCADFVPDLPENRVGHSFSCCNCLYRIEHENGFLCKKQRL